MKLRQIQEIIESWSSGCHLSSWQKAETVRNHSLIFYSGQDSSCGNLSSEHVQGSCCPLSPPPWVAGWSHLVWAPLILCLLISASFLFYSTTSFLLPDYSLTYFIFFFLNNRRKHSQRKQALGLNLAHHLLAVWLTASLGPASSSPRQDGESGTYFEKPMWWYM
jgi:hypothetical protein